MLRNLNGLTGHRILAADGEIGAVKEFYFDDREWKVRYLVAGTGGWLSGRQVLISLAALKAPDWNSRTFPVALTREQVRTSPDIDTRRTVERRHELRLHRHYAWPLYWGEGFYTGTLAGGAPLPEEALEDGEERPPSEEEAALHGTAAVTGYRLHAADGPIGSVEDFIADDRGWGIRYLVADSGLLLPGRKVLISPHWLEKVDWDSSEVFLDLTREAVRRSPGFDPSVPVSEDYESALYDHYGRPKLEAVLPPPRRRVNK